MTSTQGLNTATSSLDDSSKPIKDGDVALDGGVVAASAEDERTDASSSEWDRVYRVNLSLLPVALLELLALLGLALLAYLLRTGAGPLPLTERLFRCDDPDLSWPEDPADLLGKATVLRDFGTPALYGACVALPLILVILGELGHLAFSRRPRKAVRVGCVGCKMHQLSRRLVRHVGLYLLGALCTSICVDVLKYSLGVQRPYFLSVCRLNGTCAQQQGAAPRWFRMGSCALSAPTSRERLQEASMSFPSFQAALTSYAAVFIMVYLHSVVRLRSSRVFKPLLVVATGASALFWGSSRVALRRNHAPDVLAGMALGAALAAYVSLCAAQRFRERRARGSSVQALNGAEPGQGGAFINRYFSIPHVSYRDRTGRAFKDEHGALCSPRPPDAFQKDLHKRIEDYGKRHPPNCSQVRA
ncbi:hypothetical protein ISCGN_031028 [Ixodes scapularis]